LKVSTRLTGAQRTDTPSDQPTTRRATPLAAAELEQTAIQAKSDHDRADTERQRGENREVRRRIDHRSRPLMFLLRLAQPSSYVAE
jgi:hypothetical protein